MTELNPGTQVPDTIRARPGTTEVESALLDNQRIVTAARAAGAFRLGRHHVNRLGFGAMRLSGTGAMGTGTDRDPERSAEVVRRAVELGVNHIDTAAFYFSRTTRANDVIRDALAPYPDGLTIVTKVGPGRDLKTGDWGDWVKPEGLRAHVEHNLETLGLERLAVVNYRSSGRDDVRAAVMELDAMREEGLLDHVGVSNVDAATVRHASEVAPIVCVQNRHTWGSPRPHIDDDVLAACRQQGLAFVPFSTIAAPPPAEATREQEHVIQTIAAAHGVTEAQVRIAWTLSLGQHVIVIPGTGDLGHLEENVAAAGLRFSEAEQDALAHVG